MTGMKQTFKKFGILVFGLFVLAGMYNAVVINSDSSISSGDFKFVKRLDETLGVMTPGRKIATSTGWHKLKEIKVIKNDQPTAKKVIKKIASKKPTPAALQEELDLNLIEVINPRKWQKGLTPSDFSGNLTAQKGMIEGLSINLPVESVSISYSEMTGNVFEYDLNGEVFSGLIYQVDQDSYMITLSNGPLEGTRLRFARPSSQMEVEEVQAEAMSISQAEVADQVLEGQSFQF